MNPLWVCVVGSYVERPSVDASYFKVERWELGDLDTRCDILVLSGSVSAESLAKRFFCYGVVILPSSDVELHNIAVNSYIPRWAVKLHTDDHVTKFWQRLLKGHNIGDCAHNYTGAHFDSMNSMGRSLPRDHVGSGTVDGQRVLVRSEGLHVFLQRPADHKCLCVRNGERSWIDCANGWPMSVDVLFDADIYTYVTAALSLSCFGRGSVSVEKFQMQKSSMHEFQKFSFSASVVRSFVGNNCNWSLITQVDFRGMQLTEVPVCLREAVSLQTLDLGFNEISELPHWIKAWADLREVSLESNEITQFPCEIVWLRLTCLSLSDNPLEAFHMTCQQFSSLKDLRLEQCKLQSLPSELGSLTSLVKLSLRGNPQLRPVELLDLSPFDAATYFRLLHQNGLDLQFLRIMVVGAAEQGKTCLVDRLMSGNVLRDDHERQETFGIQIKPWRPSSFQLEGEPFDIDFWDCAGQPHFYPTHQLFMARDALFWVVFSLGEADKDPSAAVRQVVDFVRFVRSAVPEVWILIVGTKRDLMTRKGLVPELNVELHKELKDDPFIIRPKEGWYVVPVHCRDSKAFGDDGLSALRKVIEKHAADVGIKKRVPKLYFDVESKVLQYSKDLGLEGANPDSLFADKEADARSPVLDKTEFRELLGLAAIKNGLFESVLRYLEIRGVVLLVGELVVLAPQWLINNVVNGLFEEEIGDGDGVIEEDVLLSLWTNVSEARKQAILQLLQKYEVAFPVGEGKWFIPIIAREWKQVDAKPVFGADARTFHVRLSAPIYGLYSLLLYRWFCMYHMASDLLIRRNKFAIAFRNNNNALDACLIELGTSELTFRVSKGGEWLAEQLIDRLERLVQERFPSMKVWAFARRDVKAAFETEEFRSQKTKTRMFKVYECKDLLPGGGYSQFLKEGQQYDVKLVFATSDSVFALQCAHEFRNHGLRCFMQDCLEFHFMYDKFRFRETVVLWSSALRSALTHEVIGQVRSFDVEIVQIDETPFANGWVLARLSTNSNKQDAACLASNILRLLKRRK